MSLALLTRGYICRGGGGAPDIECGKGPDIVDADPLAPVIDHGRRLDEPLAPEIVHGVEEGEDPCP